MYSPVASPARRLRIIRRGRYPLVLRVRLPAIDANSGGCTGPLASARDQIAEATGVGNAPVRLAAFAEQAMAGEMDVLKIQKNSDVLRHEGFPPGK
jgi:hypothetical protein